MGGAVLCAALLIGCGSDDGGRRPVPAEMLLSPAALPSGFTAAQLGVAELVAANAEQLSGASSTVVSPPQCRPVADATFNAKLTPANAAVLAATGLSGSVTELVSATERDVGADVRASTRDCATTSTSVSTGSMTGAVITTVHRRLDPPSLDSTTSSYLGAAGSLQVIEMFVVRSTVTTTIADGSASTTISLAAYATGRWLSDAPDAPPVTVQLTSVGVASDFAKPTSPPRAPLPDADFVALFGKALTAAGDAAH